MTTRNFLFALTLSLVASRTVWAAESSCHDFSGHREVLNEGSRHVYGGSHRSIYRYDDLIESRVGHWVPSSVEDCVNNVLRMKKSGYLEGIREDVERDANRFFQAKKYGECHEFLEKVLDNLEPKDRAQYYDIIAICYLLKEEKLPVNDKSVYLEKMIGIVDKTVPINDYTKRHFEKIAQYVVKAVNAQSETNSPMDPEVTLRIGLLSLITSNKNNAIKMKNKVVSNFRNNLIFYPDQLKSVLFGAGFDNLIKKNPERYLSEEEAVAFKKGKEMMLSGAVSLCREVGNSEDLKIVANCWIREMTQSSLEPSKQALLKKVLPENSRSEFRREFFAINCADFAKVFEALRKRGWNEESSKFEEQFFLDSFIDSKKPGVEQISRYYFLQNKSNSALEIYSKSLKPIADLNEKEIPELLFAHARIVPLYEDLNKFKVSPNNAVFVQTKIIYDSVKHNYDVHKCLELAEELTETGWKLVDQGDAKEALKLYKSALDIRAKNLPKDSKILACTYKDAGCAAALDNDFPFADDCFKKALEIFFSLPNLKDDDLIVTLESYGSLLNKNNRYSEAQKIYARLKEIR